MIHEFLRRLCGHRRGVVIVLTLFYPRKPGSYLRVCHSLDKFVSLKLSRVLELCDSDGVSHVAVELKEGYPHISSKRHRRFDILSISSYTQSSRSSPTSLSDKARWCATKAFSNTMRSVSLKVIVMSVSSRCELKDDVEPQSNLNHVSGYQQNFLTSTTHLSFSSYGAS